VQVQSLAGTLATSAFMKAKAQLDAKDSDGSTPLHKAAWRGHTPVVQALLKAGIDKSIKDSDGYTAADKATDAGKKAVAGLLSTK